MDRVEVSTVVHLPPEEVYEFLIDFPRYARYSKYLREVTQYGDGDPGTEYDMEVAWWKLSYTARSRVTAVDPPERIDWAIVKDIDAEGRWLVEELEDPPGDAEAASQVRLIVEFDRGSADSDAIDLPAFVSFGWVLDKITPKVVEEAERVTERIVADLEGERRDVELTVHDRPSSV